MSGNIVQIFCCLASVLIGFATNTNASAGRMVSEQIITIDEAPYTVQLRKKDFVYCGGTLVHELVVVTAAHCFDTHDFYDITIVGGASTRSDAGIQRRIAAANKHPIYKRSTMDMDWIVLKLDAPMRGPNIQAIPLASANVKTGDIVQVSGWGFKEEDVHLSHELRTAKLAVVSQDICADKYSRVTDNMFCAYAEGLDSCGGDSGGPVVHNGELVGIVSWGPGCARLDAPGVYTNVFNVRGEIQNFINFYLQ